MARVLLVLTSHDRLGDTTQGTGAWLEELAQAYFVFADSGVGVDVASPRGGAAPIDPASRAAPWLSATGERLLADPVATAKIQASLRLDTVDAARYSSLYIVGGAGTVWDLPGCPPLGRLIEALLRAGRPVAAVCHGVTGLAAARTAGGEPIVKGRKVTAFSNREEEQVGYVPILPVLPENLMRSLGAEYSCAEPWQEHVVVDGTLMTGQNPASAAPLARAVLSHLGSAS